MSGHVVRRRFKRSVDDPHYEGSTHLIKVGYDRNELMVPEKRGKGKVPGKLPGFLITFVAKGPDRRYIIDYAAMAELGYDAEKIGRAKELQLKAAPGELLPTTLHFIIRNDAKFIPPQAGAAEGHWEFPGTFFEQFRLQKLFEVENPFTKKTATINLVFCRGDGNNAIRKQRDGTERVIKCVPMGATDDPAEWCQYSVPDERGVRECRDCSRLTVCVYKPGPRGEFRPMSNQGLSASYKLDSTSDINPIGIVKELAECAKQVNGNLALIPGTLTFQSTERAYAGGQAQVGNIILRLDRVELERRKQRIHQWYVEERGAVPLAITAPEESDPDPIDPPDTPAPDGMDATYQPADVTVEAEVVAPEIGLVTPAAGAAMSAAPPPDDRGMVMALGAWAQAKHGDNPRAILEELNGQASIIMGKKITTIDKCGWFLNGDPGARDAARRKLLREICAALVVSGEMKGEKEEIDL